MGAIYITRNEWMVPYLINVGLHSSTNPIRKLFRHTQVERAVFPDSKTNSRSTLYSDSKNYNTRYKVKKNQETRVRRHVYYQILLQRTRLLRNMAPMFEMWSI